MKKYIIIFIFTVFAIGGCQSYGDNTVKTEEAKKNKREVDSLLNVAREKQRILDSLENVQKQNDEKLREIQKLQDSTKKIMEGNN